MTTQGWRPPPQSTPAAASSWPALLAAAGVLSVVTPVLAVVSFFTVGFLMDALLTREDACRTYACGIGAGWVLIFLSLGWMCVMWVAGLVAATLAVRRTVSPSRAIIAALITAVAVTVIAMAVDWAFVVWSV